METIHESKNQESALTKSGETTIVEYEEGEVLPFSYQKLPQGISGFHRIPRSLDVIKEVFSALKVAPETGLSPALKRINDVLVAATRPQFGWAMGTVTSVRKWNEMSIQGSGGGGSISGGGGSFHMHDGYGHGHVSPVSGRIDPINISSSNTSKSEIWFKRKDGGEEVIKVTGDFAVKEGNLLSLAYVHNTGMGCQVFAVINHTASSWIRSAPVEERPLKNRPLQLSVCFGVFPLLYAVSKLQMDFADAMLPWLYAFFILAPFLYLALRIGETVWLKRLGLKSAVKQGRILFSEISNLKVRAALRYYLGQNTH